MVELDQKKVYLTCIVWAKTASEIGITKSVFENLI